MSNVIPLWNRTVKAIAAICGVEERFPNQRPGVRLVETLVSLLLKELMDDQRSLSVECSMRALAILCNGRPQTLTTTVRNLTEVVCEDLKNLIPMLDGEDIAFRRALPLLQGLVDFFLPCCDCTDVDTEALLELAVNTWNVVERLPEGTFDSNLAANRQMLEWCLGIFQFSVSRCDESSQRQLLLKMFDPFVGASSQFSFNLRVRDVWIIGFFASAILALRPSVQVPQVDEVLRRLLAAAVSPSCNSVNFVASEAVGCMLNKWHAISNNLLVRSGIDSAITEATDIIIKGEWISELLCHQSGSSSLNVPEKGLLLKTKCIKLLAYAGKGLAMRGHIAVSDIAMLLLNLVQCKKSLTDSHPGNLLDYMWPTDEEKTAVSRAAAEALGLIAKDSKSSVCKQSHSIVKPLYQQRFFVCMLPPLMLVLKEADEQERVMLYYAFGNLVAGIPTSVILTDSKRVFPFLLEGLSALSCEERDSSMLLSVLLVVSAMLVDKNAAEIASQHVPAIVGRLLNLIRYPYSAVVRETSLLCLGALVALPYARVFPFRSQVLKSLTSALDDPKRSVRKEAIRCRQAWDSMAR